MKKRIFAAIMISIASLTLSEYSFINQAGTVCVEANSQGTGVMQSILDSADKEFQRIINKLTTNLAGLHKKKADPAVLNGITAEYYGLSKPISEIANITVRNANELVIYPYDQTCLGSIEKAILSSDIGITPENDGKRLILKFPRLTRELRIKTIQEITSYGDQAKRQIRNIRKNKLDQLKEKIVSGEITQSEADAIDNKLQQLFCDYNIKVTSVIQNNKDLLMS